MRNEKIDVLRFVGLSMIILAHVGPPDLVFQIRNFDVPLMVLVSGASYAISHKVESYAFYVWRRVQRLVFPVWIFFVSYFVFRAAFHIPAPPPSFPVIAGALLFFSGIDYVWIIRVFLLVALLAPFLLFFSQAIKRNFNYFFVLFFCYVFYEGCLILFPYLFSGWVYKLVDKVFLYAIPFSILFAVGVRFHGLSDRAALCTGLCCLTLFFGFMAFYWLDSGRIVYSQVYKYPPSYYYLLYSVGVSLCLWACGDYLVGVVNKVGLVRRFVYFVSANSIWIYLWHILFVDALSLVWFVKYFAVFSGAVSCFAVQYFFLKNVVLRRVDSNAMRSSLKMLFTG